MNGHKNRISVLQHNIAYQIPYWEALIFEQALQAQNCFHLVHTFEHRVSLFNTPTALEFKTRANFRSLSGKSSFLRAENLQVLCLL